MQDSRNPTGTIPDTDGPYRCCNSDAENDPPAPIPVVTPVKKDETIETKMAPKEAVATPGRDGIAEKAEKVLISDEQTLREVRLLGATPRGRGASWGWEGVGGGWSRLFLTRMRTFNFRRCGRRAKRAIWLRSSVSRIWASTCRRVPTTRAQLRRTLRQRRATLSWSSG